LTILSYSRTRLQLGACFFVLAGLLMMLRISIVSGFAGGRAWDPVANFRIDGLLVAFLLIAGAPLARILYLLAGDLAAIRALPEGLQVTGFFGRRLVPWDGIVVCHQVDYGNFLHRNRWLNLRYVENGASRAVRVPLILAARPSGGHMSLPEKIERARADALGRTAAAAADRPPGAEFDPDAAIQRYLKAKAEESAAAPAAPAPEAPAPAPMRPRPAFGRKGL